MKTTPIFVAISLALATCASAQVVPSATSGGATVSYALRYSQSANFSGRALGNWQTANGSGSLMYASNSTKFPLRADYTGGYTGTLHGPSRVEGYYQRFALSQTLALHLWTLSFGDDVSYRPQAPLTGFSGIPGTGEPIGGTGSTAPTSQSVLTLNTHVLNNNAHAQVQHILNYMVSANAGASYYMLIYPDANGIDTNGLSANGGLNFRFNARNTATSSYGFSQFTYTDSNFEFQSHSAMFGYQRGWSKALTTSGSIGPEWIASSGSGPRAFPASTMISAQASLGYETAVGSLGLNYTRGTSGGSGFMMGSKSDLVSGSFTHVFDKRLTLEWTGGYRRSSQLSTKAEISSEFGGIQSSVRLGRHLSAFANYTATSQSSTTPLRPNVLNQLMQTVSFGIGYSGGLNRAH